MSGLGDMGNLLKQAQEMQRQVDKVRAELRARVVTGSSSRCSDSAGGGTRRGALRQRYQRRPALREARPCGRPVPPRSSTSFDVLHLLLL